MSDADLNARLLAAHQTGDSDALVALYTEAADLARDPDRAGFFLTHAWIFALELGDHRAEGLAARLRASGRLD